MTSPCGQQPVAQKCQNAAHGCNGAREEAGKERGKKRILSHLRLGNDERPQAMIPDRTRDRQHAHHAHPIPEQNLTPQCLDTCLQDRNGTQLSTANLPMHEAEEGHAILAVRTLFMLKAQQSSA